MGIKDHLTCLLRNIYGGQEAIVRMGRRTSEWFKIGKGVWQGCILSFCLFNLYAECACMSVCLIASVVFNSVILCSLPGSSVREGNGNTLQYSCLENPRMEEPGRLQSMVLLRVWHDWETSLSLFTFMHWRRKWQPTPVFLPGESQGWGSLVGCRLRGCTELDMTEVS